MNSANQMEASENQPLLATSRVSGKDYYYDKSILTGQSSSTLGEVTHEHLDISLKTIIIYIVVLTAESARGVLFPTLWLNISSVGGNKISQGLAVAAFSMGRIITSPILGFSSDTYGYKNSLISSNAILLLGCLIYIFAKSVNSIIFAQFIIGCGSGSLSVTRAFIAEHSHVGERTVALAHLTALQYGGFTVTPALGSLLAYIGYHHQCTRWAIIEFNEFTVPAMSVILFSVVSIMTLLFMFTKTERQYIEAVMKEECKEEIELTEVERDLQDCVVIPRDNNLSISEGIQHWCFLPFQDKVVIAGCVLNITTKGTIGVFEAVGSGFAIGHFNLSGSTVGLIFSIFGFIGVLALLSFSWLTKHFSDTNLMIFGIAVMSLSCLVMVLPFQYVSEKQFFLSVALMYGIGYPIGHTVLVGLFSKLLKSGPQGTILGWFGSAGSFARIVFPILAGWMAESVNEVLVFGLLALMLSGSVIFVWAYSDIVISRL